MKHDQGISLKDFISQMKEMTFVADDSKTYKKAILSENVHL